MSTFRWLSLTVAAITSAVSATVVAYAVGPAWQEAGGSAIDIALAALLVGAVVGGFLWLVAGAHDGELRRALALLRSVSAGEADSLEIETLRFRFGLGPLVSLAHDGQRKLRARVAELALERRAAEAQFDTSESRRSHLEVVLATLGEAVLVTDALDELVLANDAAAKLLNLDVAAALRKPADEALPDAGLARLIRDTREGGRSVPRLRRRAQHAAAGGRTFDVTLQCLAPPPSADEPDVPRPGCDGVVTVLRDVTREVESGERRSDFVASVSHELRTPLSSIKGCLEMLIDGEAADAEARTDFYHIIQTETNRLSRLIDSVMSINRIESGLARASLRPVALAELLAGAVAAMRPQARGKNIELSRWDGAGAAAAAVLADRDMIAEVLHQLLGNAIKFTPAGGRVAVGAELDAELGVARVSVTDTGVGIPPASLPHVFEKFYRVADHAHLGKGTGLGLNLAKHVIETVHGGTIGATSTPGRGSTFAFTIPLARPADRSLVTPLPRVASGAADSRTGGDA